MSRRVRQMPVTNHALMEALVACGVSLPEELVTVEVHVPVDGLMQITYTCNVTGALAHKIGKALQVLAVRERLESAR